MHCALGKAYHKLEDYTQAKLELEKGARMAGPSYIRQAQLWKWLEITCRHWGLTQEAEQLRATSKTVLVTLNILLNGGRTIFGVEIILIYTTAALRKTDRYPGMDHAICDAATLSAALDFIESGT